MKKLLLIGMVMVVSLNVSAAPRLSTQLELSKEQKAQIKVINSEYREAAKPINEKIKELRNEIKELKKEKESKFVEILNDSQKVKYNELVNK